MFWQEFTVVDDVVKTEVDDADGVLLVDNDCVDAGCVRFEEDDCELVVGVCVVTIDVIVDDVDVCVGCVLL